jgi:phage major head subunit gpT-like protein
VFLDAFDTAVRTFDPWTTAITLNDFRNTYTMQATFPALEELPEHAAYTYGGPLGPQQPMRLAVYGKILGFTRQAFLRDDVPGLAQLTSALATAASAVESDVVYTLLVSNPVLADGQPLFSTAHKNLMAPADLTAASLTLATSALAAQTVGGQTLHLAARYLLVGTALAAQARQLVTTMTPANVPADSGPLSVIDDSRIPGKDWYVTCDPRQRATLVTAHLTGAEGPELLSRDEWNIDARGYKGRDTFGVGVADWRGLVKTPGT